MATRYHGSSPIHIEEDLKFSKWNSESNILSVAEMRDDYKLECNLCRKFDDVSESCKEKHRIKKIGLRDGPFDCCYVRIVNGCDDFNAVDGLTFI